MKALKYLLLLPWKLFVLFWGGIGYFVLLWQIKPRKGFDQLPRPPAPDYSLPAAWASLPEAPGKALFCPEGVDLPSDVEPPADLFFLHPTTYYGRGSWNQPADYRRAREILEELILPGQASVFNHCCRIFAPRYRQATLYSFLDGGPNGRRALELAYQDTLGAFRHYLEQHNGGRPFFLAGHSQGSVHAIRLLEEEIDPDPSVMERLVAAYIVGFSFPLDKLERFQRLVASAGPEHTGCVVAWDTYLEGRGPNHRLDRSEHWYSGPESGHWQRRAGKVPLCVNPLTFDRRPDWAPAELNRGAVYSRLAVQVPWRGFGGEAPLGFDTRGLSKPRLGEVAARCGEDGYLRITKPKAAAFRVGVLPGGNYHNHDIALFYMNLRHNVSRRLAAFMKKSPAAL